MPRQATLRLCEKAYGPVKGSVNGEMGADCFEEASPKGAMLIRWDLNWIGGTCRRCRMPAVKQEGGKAENPAAALQNFTDTPT